MNQKDLRYYSAIVLILAVATAVGVWQLVRQQEEIEEDLLEFAKVTALNIPPQMVESLQGNESDLENPQYRRLKTLLMQAIAIESEAKFAYVFGMRPDGKLFFYADSEPVTSPDYSPPGQVYEEAKPQDRMVFVNGLPQAFANTDSWGSWISVEIPIVDESGSRVIASMNMDISQSSYYQRIIFSGMVPLLIGILFVLVLFIIRRLSLKDEMILNQRAVYLAITAHDLKTPLTAIKWTAEILQESLKSSENSIKENLTAITGACQEMFTFIDDLASASKTNTGNLISSNREKVDIGELTKKIVANMGILVNKKKLSVDFDVDDGLIVMGDPNALRRGIANLVSNAVKYSTLGGKIEICAKNENGKLVLSIKDAGMGIPKDELQKVLVGYYRAKNARLSGIPGTGLGLYYAKKVAEAYRGSISLSSEVDKGTTATMTLPLAP